MDSLTPLSRKYKAVLSGGVVVLGLLAVFALFGSRGWHHLKRLQRKQDRLEALAFRLERENSRVRNHLQRLETDDAYLEQLVREQLGWVRPGEMLYRVSGISESAPGAGRPESRPGLSTVEPSGRAPAAITAGGD